MPEKSSAWPPPLPDATVRWLDDNVHESIRWAFEAAFAQYEYWDNLNKSLGITR